MLGVVENIRTAYLEYQKLEGRVYGLLSKQQNYGETCDCERPEKISLRGEDDITIDYCAFCGGEISI